jgi:uncharacterized membrane protein YjgN (DUF898 family)
MADTCPKCGYTSLDAEKCPQCGVLVPVYRVALEKFRRGNAGGAGAAGGVAVRMLPRTVAPPPRATVAPAVFGNGSSNSRPFSFHGSGGTLLGITIVNVCLTLLTLGVYSFWAKVRVRKYLLSQSEVEHDRFAYHGTGRELFNGAVKAGLVFGLPIGLLQAAANLTRDPVVVAVASLVAPIVFLFFVPVAMVGARRYRLSRTSWRAIRFSFDGTVKEYLRIFVPGSLLTGLTLGLYYPLFHARSHAFMMSHSRFGQRAFGFDGTPRDTFRPFLTAVLLFLPTLGLSWIWHLAWRRRYYWSHTTFDFARFRATVTGGQLFELHVVNALLMLVTLGLAWSWVRVRNADFALSTLKLEGAVDLSVILQVAPAGSATGDALSGFLGAGFDTGA